ncbi:MAG: tetratricopeptide repeat protein [Candidatus Heimdallarchaeota archaeon]
MMNIKNKEISTQINLKDTIALCENSLIQEGLNIDTLWQLADCHYLEGNFLRALNCYLKLLSFEPENARIWNKLAVVFIRLGETKAAVDMSRIAYRMINNQYFE